MPKISLEYAFLKVLAYAEVNKNQEINCENPRIQNIWTEYKGDTTETPTNYGDFLKNVEISKQLIEDSDLPDSIRKKITGKLQEGKDLKLEVNTEKLPLFIKSGLKTLGKTFEKLNEALKGHVTISLKKGKFTLYTQNTWGEKLAEDILNNARTKSIDEVIARSQKNIRQETKEPEIKEKPSIEFFGNTSLIENEELQRSFLNKMEETFAKAINGLQDPVRPGWEDSTIKHFKESVDNQMVNDFLENPEKVIQNYNNLDNLRIYRTSAELVLRILLEKALHQALENKDMEKVNELIQHAKPAFKNGYLQGGIGDFDAFILTEEEIQKIDQR